MSHARFPVMDPANSRGESPEARFARQKTLWTIIASVAAGAALGSMVAVSCLDRGQARRATEEPAYVETTATPLAAPAPAATPTVAIARVAPRAATGAAAVDDSAGGPGGRGASAGTTNVTSAPVAATATGVAPPSATPATSPRAPGTLHPYEVRPPTDTSSGIAPATTTGAATPAGSAFTDDPEAGADPSPPHR